MDGTLYVLRDKSLYYNTHISSVLLQMIDKNKYVQSLTQAKNDLKNGKSWGEVWTTVKNEFKDLPNEQIDYDLGLEWRQTNAYQLYINGNLRPVKPPAKYDYFADLSLAKDRILKGENIDKITKEINSKYKSIDNVKILTDLNSIKTEQPKGRLPVAGPMTPEIKKAQTVTPKEQKQLEAYQKTLDPAYLSGKKDAVKDAVKIEQAAIEQAKRIPAQVVELPREGKVTVVEPPSAKDVEIVKPLPFTPVPKILSPETPYTEKAPSFIPEPVPEPKPMSIKPDPIKMSLLQAAFGKDDPDAMNFDRKYGDNVDKIALPENKDIYTEVAVTTKANIDEIIKPILGATTPGYAFITEKLDEFYDKEKTNRIQYEVNKAINDPKIDNKTVPNPFFAEVVLPKYELTLKDLAINVDMSIKGSTLDHIETKKWQDNQTITMMSPIFGSTPMLIIPDEDVKAMVNKRIEKETKLEKWQIDLGKARRDKEQLLTTKLPKAIAEFSKLGLGDFGDRVPTMEEINKAIVERQLKINNIPEDSIIGQVRVAQKDMLIQEAGIVGVISDKLGKVFGAKGTEPANVLREKFGTEADELIKTLSAFSKLDATGKIRNELNDVYTKSVETENSLMQKYKEANIEVERLLATPGLDNYIAAASKDLSAISQTEYVGLLNFQAQNKAVIDKLNMLGKRIEDIKAEMARNSTTGNNAVNQYKAINQQIKTGFGGMLSAITSDNFKKMITSGNIMSADEANQLIKLAKVYEKNRVFVEQNNDKYLKELDNYNLKTQQALLEEGVTQDKIQSIFENISKIANEIADADKRIKYYSGFDEIYELQRQSKVAEAAAKAWDPLHFKTLKQSTKEVFGEEYTPFDYKDVKLEMGKQLTVGTIETAFGAVGKVLSVPINAVDGMIRLNAKQGNYLINGLNLKGGAIDKWREYNNKILAEVPLRQEMAQGAANFYKYLYTEAFPYYVNYARDAATFMEEALDWEAGNIDLIREWFLGGLKSAGLSEETRNFLESYSEVLDPFVQGTRLMHSIRVNMNNPDLPENADLLWTKYDKKVITTPMDGKLEDFLDPWDYERIDEIKALNKNITDFNNIPEGTELMIRSGEQWMTVSDEMKRQDARNNFIAGKVSEDRFVTDEVTSLYDIVKPGPDRERIISSILDLNDFNGIGLDSANTKDWTEIPKGITIRVPKSYEEPILSNMLFSTENRLKLAKEHPVRYTLFEEAIMKNVIDPINFLWIPGLKAVKLGSTAVLKGGYNALSTAAERSVYMGTAKKMADFTWSLSRVLFEKKAPFPEFYNNPEKLGLYQLISKGMKINSLDLTTLSTLRTKLAAMSVVNSLPAMFRPLVKMTDNEINNLREMNTIKYIESLNKLMDEQGLTKDQIETFLINYIKKGPNTTQAERDIFRVFSENMGLSLQELEDIIDTSHPEFYYDKIYTSKETNLKDVVKPEIYNDPVKLKELIRVNDFEKKQINPEKIPAGVKVIVSEDNFISKIKDQIYYSRYVTKPEVEYMMLRMDKLDSIGMEAFFNTFRRVPDKDKPFRLIMNQKEFDRAISRMHVEYPQAKKSINQAVDLAKEFRRRTNFFADAVEKDILVPVKMTDNIKLFAIDKSGDFNNVFTVVKDPDTGIINLVYNKQYTGKFGLGMDLISFNTKLYSKKINNLDTAIGTLTTEMKRMEVTGGRVKGSNVPQDTTWFRNNPDGSTELMIQKGSGQKPKVGYRWAAGSEGKEITLRSLLVTAAIRKDIGWLRTFFSDGEYARIYGSRIKGTEEFTEGLIDKIITSTGKKIKVKESYKRDFFDVINDIMNKKKFIIDEQEIAVFNGDKQAEFLLALTASVQDLYNTNRKLFNVTYGTLKKTYDLIKRDLANDLKPIHQMTPIEELTMMLMEKIDKHPNVFSSTHSKIIGRLLNDVNITPSELRKIAEELESLANSRRMQLKKAIILNKLRKEGLSEAMIQEVNSGIRTKFLFNTAKGETPTDVIRRTLATIPGFISPEDAQRFKIGKLSDDQIEKLGLVNKVEYLYATNKINRRFTYLVRKNIAPEMMPAVIDKFTRPLVDAAVDLMAKLDMDKAAPKRRMVTIITDAIAHSQEKKIALILPEGIVSHEVIDKLNQLEIDAAKEKLLLIQEKTRYKKMLSAKAKFKNDKMKFFEQESAKKVAGLTERYNKLRDAGVKYAEEHGETFKDRLTDEFEISANPRSKKELTITPEIEKALYSVKTGEHKGSTLVISDRTPEGKSVIEFLRSRPKEFIEGSDFVIENFDKIKDIMTSKEITQLMLDKGMNPFLYWMLDQQNGLTMFNDDVVNLLRLSVDPTLSDELKKIYFDKMYKALIQANVFSFEIFKKEFPHIDEQRLMLMDKNELVKEINSSNLSKGRKQELINLARRKGASVLQKQLELSEIEKRTVTGKTEQGLDTLMSETKSAKKQTPVGENISARDIPEQFDADKLKEVSLASGEGRESKINLAFDDKVMEEMENLNSAFYSIKRALGISDISGQGLEPGTWRLSKSFEGNLTTSDQLALLNTTDGKFIGVGELTDEVKRRTTPHEKIAENFDKEKFVSKLGVAFDVPNKVGHEELEASIKKTAELGKLRVDKARIERHIDKIDANIDSLAIRITDNNNLVNKISKDPKIKLTEKEVRIEEYTNLSIKFNKSIYEFQRTKNQLGLELDTISRKIDSMTDASDFLVNADKFNSESYKYIEERISELDNSLKEINRRINVEPNGFIHNNLSLSKAIAEKELARYKSILDIIVPWNLAKTNNITLTAKEIYQAAKGYISPDMDDKLNTLMKLNDEFAKEANAGNLKKIGLDDVNLPTVKMTKVSSDSLKTNFWDSLSKIKKPSEIRVPKVDTITIKSIENTQLLKDSIETLLERTSSEKRYPLVIDLTGKLKQKLERHMPEAAKKIHIITDKDISSEALSNINLSAGTSLTQAEVKAYNEIVKNINEHGPVWLFGEEKELVNPSKLKDAFFNKALDEDEKALLSQARKDFDKINSKFRESVKGDTMFFPEDPDSLVSEIVGLKDGDITKETIAQSAAITASRTNKYMNDADISRYIVENNLGESKVMSFQDAVKNEKLLIIADERHGTLYREARSALDEARKNGMTFVFPKDMTRGEMLIYEYLNQFSGVKLSSIKNNELALLKRQIMSGKPKMLFTISKEFADNNREQLFKAWSKADDFENGIIRIYNSSEKMMRDIQNNIKMQIKKWQNTTENFLPEFTKQKALYGERPQDILVDLASVKKTNDIRKALDTNTDIALRDYREQLLKTIPETADDITKKALIKQIENEVESTRILMDQIKREVFSFGKDKRFFEQLRSKISSRLLFYGMYDQPQIGLNPGYPDIVPEYVMALRSADWMLRNIQKLSDNVSSAGRFFMGTWIRAILLYRPRWQVWNALGDGIRAVGASRNVLIMLQYVEALTRAMSQFYWKALKETSKLPLELLPKASRNRLARFMKHDLIDIDFTKPIAKTKYFELKSSLADAERLVRDGGITMIGETVTPADAARMVSSGIDRIIASPEYAKKKIDLIRDSGLASRLSKRLKVIDSDIQIVSSALEASRRAVLAWNLLYKKSMNMAAAEMKVKKWMFDYRELTLAGRLMRNFFPFYTFTSKSLQLYLGLCAKYGPGVWHAAAAILDAFEEQHKNLPDQYKDRIEIGDNVWWLTSFGVQEYFEIIFNPTKMVESFIKNPSRMLFGLSLGPIGSAAMTAITGQGYYDTTASTQEFYDRGWTTEDIQNFRNKEANKFSDSITFDKAEESLYTFLAANLPFGQLVYDLNKVDLSTVLRSNTTFNSKKVRTLMNYFFGANYKKMEDIEIVFDTIMKLPPGEQYILQQSLKKENPDLYDYLQQYSLLSKITKVLNSTGKDWADKSKELVTSVVVYNYYNLESSEHGSGDEWLNENSQYAKIMQEVWSTGAQTSSKIYGKEKFDVVQIQSIANKILSKVKDVDDKKLAKMKLAGITVPFKEAIKKQDLRSAMYDMDGNFRLNSLDQLANIVDAYGLEGELFDINKVKSEAERSYQDWKNLSLKAREEKRAADQKYYDRMSIVFKVLPDNLENLSQEESAKAWNKYNELLNTLILSNPEYKARYLADMPEWQRKYNEFKAEYSKYWTELRSKFDDPDNNFFKQFNKKPTWFRDWYFYDNPEKKITFPKFSLIFNELEKNPKLNYYDLFFQKLGDKDWDNFRKVYFKSNPEAFKKAQEYLKFQKMWNEFNNIDNLTWEGKRQKADYLKQHPDLTAYWARNDKSEEVIIKQKQEKYFDILYQIPADGKGRDYIIKYYLLKAKADKFLEDNPDVQAYWDSREKKVYTGKEKVIRDLLVDYNKLTLQVDKTEYLLKHPELSEYFLNLAPPGIRKFMILEKLYFQIEGTDKRAAFVKARPELADFWEVKKMPKSFLLDPSVRKEYQTKLDNFKKFTDAIQAKDDVKVEMYRKSVDVEPDTSTEEGKWLASQMYQAAMKAWASTFGSIISTYFFRTLPSWIRNRYFEAHPKSKMLSYRTLSRAMEEGLRIYAQQNKVETWADSLMYKYGKDMPYQLKEKVSREMIRRGKWTDRTSWTKEQWNEYQLDRLAKTGRIRRDELSNNRLLSLEAQRAIRTFTMSMFAKPLKEYGTINVFGSSPEKEKDPKNIFLGTEDLVLRTIPVNKRIMKLFDYES